MESNPITRHPITRRQAITATAALALAGRALAQTKPDATPRSQPATTPTAEAPAHLAAGYTPVIVPNGWTLPHRFVDGVKIFHLVAEPVDHQFAPGLTARCWGYNGSVHGPLIEAVEGDHVRIYVTNRLPAATTVHWHGVLVPSGMDGVGGLSQAAIQPGETFMYEFKLRQHGTYMYHSHHDEMTQMGMGLTGMFVIHPIAPVAARPDRDFALLMHEWSIPVGADRPNPNEMTDFNVLTFNAKVFPATAPLIIKTGDRVRIRLGNLSAMDHHPIHMHGATFVVTATDGGEIPESARRPDTSVLVAVGQTRTIEFIATNPGDWAMHCHMTHHVMNQMGHHGPNMIGVDASGLDASARTILPGYMTMGSDGMGDMAAPHMRYPANSIPMVGGKGPHDVITMGGMFTILKVREMLPGGYDADPGWYQASPEQLANLATSAALERDGVDVQHPPRNPAVDGSASRANPLDFRPVPPAKASAAGPAVYTCSMHPEVASDKPGTCPKCGMKLVHR